MIPAEVANTLRAQLPNASGATQSQQTQPVPPAQRITDVLSNLVPGQRVFADIQAMLPNGTYRAVVAQRDITLALPFSAKAGDSLELEVVETDGKLSLAVVANRGQAEGRGGQQGSVSTSLTSAGKLIGDLMQEIDGEGKRAPAAPLNGNQALVSTMPRDGAQLAPVLKQALTQSGMFYEAHQARWVKGQLPTEQLRQEPQGKIPVAAQGLPNFSGQATGNATAQPINQPTTQPATVLSGLQSLYRALTNQPSTTQAAAPLPDQTLNQAGDQLVAPGINLPDDQTGVRAGSPQGLAAENATDSLARGAPQSSFAASDQATEDGTPTQQLQQSVVRVEQQNTTTSGIPRDLTPLVQQQLDGLANQNFAWQGQIWPGQKMWWEIGENPEDSKRVGEEATAKWHTRLKLTLPQLGEIDARIHLQPGGELGIRISSGSNESEARMRGQLTALHQQLEAAGLKVRQILIDHEIPSEG